MKRAFVVLNPASGQGGADTVRRALERSAELGDLVFEVYEVVKGEPVAEIVRAALERGFDLVVAAGGDGTISAVARGIAGTPVPMGIVPLGTGNLVARALGVPFSPHAAVDLLTGEHRVRDVDAMEVGGELYVLNVGVGISSATVRDIRREDKRRFGFIAYIGAGLKVLFRFRLTRFTLRIDGRTFCRRAAEVGVVNCDFLGEFPWRWWPDIQPDDGHVDVALALTPTAIDTLRETRRLIATRRKPKPSVRWLRARKSVRIDADTPLPVQGDGDLIGQTPVEVTVVPGAVRVIVPAKRATSRR